MTALFPTLKSELIEDGYAMVNDTRCKGCRVKIQWWFTPRGIYVPFEVSGNRIVLHYLNCPTMTPACHERLAQYGTEV